jgi:CRP-like cAMP-binding protein
MKHHDQLLKHIARFSTLTNEQELLLTSKMRYKLVGKKDFLLQEGQVCTNYYFVLSGCMRFYKIANSGFEQILQFGIPSWWLSDYQSINSQKPSDYYIQAVDETEVLVLTKHDADELFNSIPAFNTYFRLMMQKAYTASLKKIELMLCDSAEDRYLQFTTTFPDFVQLIPQYMLASFLGFTPQFLSGLRAKKL